MEVWCPGVVLVVFETVERTGRRFQLRSWINGIEQPPIYAKPWELVDFKPKRRGELDSKVKRYLDYTFVKRERSRKADAKVPGYKKHVSWREVMAYLGCSRRTAFRKIKEGFQFPKQETVRCALQLRNSDSVAEGSQPTGE